MSDQKTDLKAQMQEKVEQLKTLRDEVKLKLHLAGMDAMDGWKKIEPTLDEADRLLLQASDASHSLLDKLVKGVKDFRATHKI